MTVFNICFNRYMVECELIRASVIFLMLKVLIDTWWNVNYTPVAIVVQFASFNRYMVECEYFDAAVIR